MSGECDKCGENYLDCKCMSRDDWQSIHDKFNTDIINMTMGYKHGRLTSSELMDVIERYCEMAYKLGVKRKSRGKKRR